MKQIKRYNVTKAGKKYKDRNGVEKTNWHTIGTITEFHKDDGSISRLLEIPAIGLEANIFEIKPKEDTRTNTVSDGTPIEYPEEEINPDDIPF